MSEGQTDRETRLMLVTVHMLQEGSDEQKTGLTKRIGNRLTCDCVRTLQEGNDSGEELYGDDEEPGEEEGRNSTRTQRQVCCLSNHAPTTF